jgi:hypothetical protein
MSWRDHLVMLLTFGAAAEHCLMVQYLYAAYSLHAEGRERSPRIENWRCLGVVRSNGMSRTPLKIARSWTDRMPLESGLAVAAWLINHRILVRPANRE